MRCTCCRGTFAAAIAAVKIVRVVVVNVVVSAAASFSFCKQCFVFKIHFRTMVFEQSFDKRNKVFDGVRIDSFVWTLLFGGCHDEIEQRH